MKIIAPNKKTAIVLFNLGGPDGPEAVQPFLFNLFNDPAIIGLPNPFRRLLAGLISRKRAPTAQKIYEEIGGKSPIMENTVAQANALEASLSGHGEVKVFIAMRYWHPMADAVAKEVKDFAPDHIILLPLYPQFSTTTTGSSFKDWRRAAAAINLNAPTTEICCYPAQADFISAQAALIRTYYDEAKQFGAPRILFSAHGLPEKIIKRGDPYQMQVEMTTQAVLKTLDIEGVDYVNCVDLAQTRAYGAKNLRRNRRQITDHGKHGGPGKRA
jgi:protoporphyrin/coproporphyrin ferrochelatase